jgi:anti-sigma factor RsiW
MPDLISRFRRRSPHVPLTCRELVELVTDYLEDALPAPQRARFESHIGACDGCTDYVRQMHMTLELLGELPAEPMSPSVEADLREAFRDWKAHSGDHS